MDDLKQLKINTATQRMELEVDGFIAFIEYKTDKQLLYLIHTEVPEEIGGKGIGSVIVQKALQYAKDNGYKIMPFCPFVQTYLKRHKEWTNILDEGAEKILNNQK